MIYYNNYLAVMKKYHFLNPKGVTDHNLLINGDFQVNQRGQSSYTCDGTKRVYGVDMWSFSKSNTFMKVTENGIETDAPISQMFNKLKSGVKYTVVCSIDNVIHTKSITGGTYDTDTSQTIMYLTFNNVERILITPNGTQTINYVDLFEGEVVYKHQKEDYAIALTRCQRWLYVLRGNGQQLPCDIINTGEGIFTIHLPTEMINKPTFVSNNEIIKFVSDGNNSKSYNSNMGVLQKFGKNMIRMSYPYLAYGIPNVIGMVYLENATFTFSCEPL